MMIFRHFFTNPIRKILNNEGFVPIFRSIGVIGDSLSSGEHESLNEKNEKGFHDYYEYSWGQFLARKCGNKVINFSRGGLRCDTFFQYIENHNPFIEENRCQAYIIALGLNDINHLSLVYKDGFGSFDDVSYLNEDNNKNSFIGQYYRIIQKLRKFAPKCRIFLMSVPMETCHSKQQKKLFDKLRKMQIQMVKNNEFIYLIDLRKYAPIYDKKIKQKYFLGGHMSAMGYKFTCDMVITYIDYYIRKNIDDFKQVGFIGQDVYNIEEKW